MDTILAKKVNMGQSFVEGKRIPVTFVKAGPCVVTQVKTVEKDGYNSIQLGFGEKRIKNLTKSLLGHLKAAVKSNLAPRFLREVRLNEAAEIKVGDQLLVADLFKVGDIVQAMGISKGKGFAGGVKRWGFHGGSKTHGQSDRQRAPGSIGQGTSPGRVLKGKHMAGKMGHEQVTVKNLKVISIDSETNTIALSGPVPGPINNLIVLTKLHD